VTPVITESILNTSSYCPVRLRPLARYSTRSSVKVDHRDKDLFFAFGGVYQLCSARHQTDCNLLKWWCEIVGHDSEILAAPGLETGFETFVRLSQPIAAHRDPKELFGALVKELHRVMQFDFIGVSFRDKDSDTFQNYFILITSRAELVPEEKLTPRRAPCGFTFF
jgi:hypothetical protein